MTSMKFQMKRFRFSEDERIKSISELYSIVCHEITISEEEIWKQVLSNLTKDSSSRFEMCTVRNMRDHMLRQVATYKHCESNEATEIEKAKLDTRWGEVMKRLMTVWHNYEQLVEIQSAAKATAKKRCTTVDQKYDQETSKRIRDSPLGYVAATYSLLEIPATDEDSIIETTGESTAESAEESPICSSPVPVQGNEVRINRTTTYRNDEVFKYLAETRRLEEESRRAELKMKERIANRKLDLQYEQLNLQRAMLELEQKKWDAHVEERQSERQVFQATSNLLSVLLQTDLFKTLVNNRK